MSIEGWRRIIEVNLSGVFYAMHAQIPATFAAGGGAIVNIASILGHGGTDERMGSDRTPIPWVPIPSGSSLAPETVMSNKNSSFWSLAATFVIGAAAGATVALLYAPMSGRKLQRKLADATEKAKGAVEDSVDNVQNVLRKVGNG